MSSSRQKKGKILVVGAPPGDLAAARSILAAGGYQIQAVPDGETALAVAHDAQPDLILLDGELPEAHILEIGARLAGASARQAIPVLVAGPRDPARAIGAGAADYVVKPFVAEELLARVQTQIALRALRAEILVERARLAHEKEQRRLAEEALRDSEQAGRALVQSLSEVIYTADEAGILTYVSPGVEPLTGYQPAEVTGRHFAEFIHPEDVERAQAAFRHVAGGQGTANEYRLVTRSGEVRWLRTSTQPILDGRQLVGLQGILADITDRVQAEAQIREQNEFLTSVLESLTHPFYVLDANDYTVQIANPAARISASAGQATCYALTHGRTEPCQAREHPCPLAEIQKTGEPVTVEHTHRDASGQVRNVEVHGYPLLDKEGKVTRVIEYVLDITERKEAEAARRRSEQRFRQLLDALQEGIWVVDQDATTTFVNPRMAEMLGYTVGEMVGRSLFDFMDKRGAEITRRNLDRRRQGIREQHDFEFVHRDGRRLYALLETSPIYDEQGNYAGSIAGIQDITERRRVEEALRRSEALLTETQAMARVGGWALDPNTNEVTWTPEVYRIHEVPPEFQPRLDSALSFYPNEARLALEKAIQRAIETREGWDLELPFVTAAGRRLWVRAIGRAEYQDRRVVRLSGTFQDITEQRRTEQALHEAREAAETARRQEAERRQIAESLADVLTALNSNQPLDSVLERIAAQAMRLLGNRAIAIYRIDGETGALVLQAARGLPARPIDSTGQPVGLAVLEEAVVARRPVTVPERSGDLNTGPRAGAGGDAYAFWAHQCRALLAVPVVIEDEAYGGMLFHYADPQAFSGEAVDLATMFADQVALAVQNARLREEVRRAAASAERSRLARDLHDSVTQALFSASLVAEVLPQVWRRDPGEALEGLEELRVLTRAALSEMRTMLLELRPSALVETSLSDLLRQLAEATTSRAQISVTVDLEPVPALPPDVHVTFYRVAQEALHNAAKHAQAERVVVTLRASPPAPTGQAETWQGQVILHVSDDGQGFVAGEAAPDHLGLSIMRERAETVGAILSIESEPGQGAQVTLVWRRP